MKKLLFLSAMVFSLLLPGCNKEDNNDPEPEPENLDPVPVQKTNTIKLWVHYMPWFETPETGDNGGWGIHWTMANMNPDNVDGEGKLEIASHFYPLIGPYASSDKNVIEYHLLLMKYSGIDGLIIDWYGSSDLWDYPMNRRNTEAAIAMLDEVGLTFALTYEDQTLENLIGNGKIDNAVDGAIADFQYMEQNYFSKATYIRLDNKPLLTIFGPKFIQNGDDWTTVLQSISDKPVFLSLWHESAELGTNASGEFAWVYQNNTHIQNFYSNQAPKLDIALGSAYPGFKDFYGEGGWGSNLPWSIDYKNGETLQTTLEMANAAGAEYLQVVTWNDFGEGTMIEPTFEFNYTMLEKIQSFTGVIYQKNELEKITDLYRLRKEYAGMSQEQKILDKAFQYFVSLKTEKAIQIVDSLNAL